MFSSFWWDLHTKLQREARDKGEISTGDNHVQRLSGTGDSQHDSRESIRANHLQLTPLFFIARQADSHESLEFPICANHPIRANRANRFARITPLSLKVS